MKIVLLPTSVVVACLLLGIAANSLFPEKQPDLNGYFKQGDRLVSRFEGFDQTVLAVDGDWLHTRLEVAPMAGGPPEHFHEHFSESFTVRSGTLSILVDGEKRTLKAGETITIPAMTRHKPFNETSETVIVEGDDPKTIPVKFAYILSQLYGFMDTYPERPCDDHAAFDLRKRSRFMARRRPSVGRTESDEGRTGTNREVDGIL